jgi:putative oxidoreductase
MKKLFDPCNYNVNINLILLINRLAIACFMLVHGLGKLTKLVGSETIQFADPLGIGATFSLSLAVFAEVFCSVLIFVGLTTRLATIPLIITMIVAVVMVNANNPFGDKEMGLLYLLVYLTIAIAGPGRYSIDSMIFKKIS